MFLKLKLKNKQNENHTADYRHHMDNFSMTLYESGGCQVANYKHNSGEFHNSAEDIITVKPEIFVRR